MDPTQGTPIQPSEPMQGSFPNTKAPKIPIEPGRMQAIQEAFEAYRKDTDDLRIYTFKAAINHNLDQTVLKALSERIGVPQEQHGWGLISTLVEKGLIRDDGDELHTFLANNLREQEPEETVQPSKLDVQNKEERSKAIKAAYKEYLDVDPSVPENKIAAYRTFLEKVNKQMTEREVKSIALAYGADAKTNNFINLAYGLEGTFETKEGINRPVLDGKDPATVRRMMDTIFPSNRL